MQKPNTEAGVYNNNKKCDRKKNLKSLIRFHSANKIDKYNRGGEEERRKKRKKSRRIYRTKSKHKKESLLIS